MPSQSSESAKTQAKESEEPENIRTSVKEQAKKLNRLNTESELRNLGDINAQKPTKESMESKITSTNNENTKVRSLFLEYIAFINFKNKL